MASTMMDDFQVIKIEIEEATHADIDSEYDSLLLNEEDDKEDGKRTSWEYNTQAFVPSKKGLAHLADIAYKEAKTTSASLSEEEFEDGWMEAGDDDGHDDGEDDMEVHPSREEDDQTMNVKQKPLDAVYGEGWISTSPGGISGDASHDFEQCLSPAEPESSPSGAEKSLLCESEFSQDPDQESSNSDRFHDKRIPMNPAGSEFHSRADQDREMSMGIGRENKSDMPAEQEKNSGAKGRGKRGEQLCTCAVCNKTFNKSNLKDHMKIHTGEKAFKCPFCEKRFTLKGNLTHHLRIHTGERPYQCTVCNKTFVENSKLSIHMRSHTGEKPYHCSFCNKAFSQRGDMLRHTRTHTGEKPYQCSVCNKGFIESGKLAIHMRSHTGEKPYQCTICNRGFTESSTLSRHMSTHETQRETHRCTVCDKSFIHAPSLAAHIRIHTGENLSQCDICNKTFTTSSRLARHMISHRKEKPYECDVCNKQFSHASTLSLHRRLHTGENLVNCDVCNKVCTSIGQLSKHKKTHREVPNQ